MIAVDVTLLDREYPDEWHCLPEDDMREHEASGACWCCRSGKSSSLRTATSGSCGITTPLTTDTFTRTNEPPCNERPVEP